MDLSSNENELKIDSRSSIPPIWVTGGTAIGESGSGVEAAEVGVGAARGDAGVADVGVGSGRVRHGAGAVVREVGGVVGTGDQMKRRPIGQVR